MTLHYQFPVIQHISDVLPAIKGSPEFITAVKDTGIVVVNYVMADKDTFPAVSDEHTAIRRECRGLVFDVESGNLIARRLHKFFNVGEREDTTTLDLTRPHVVLEKLDGSMITPIHVGSGFRWGTKMGVTGVSMQAECFVAERPEYDTFAHACYVQGFTPIFEWCSNQQRIVVEQPEDRLVLLHVRELESGLYLSREAVQVLGKSFGIPVVRTLADSVGDLDTFIASVRAIDDGEGVVICFSDGHMAKVKSDWYVKLHQVKAQIERERDVVLLILNEQTDDLMPLLDSLDKERLETFSGLVTLDIRRYAESIVKVLNLVEKASMSRKDFADLTLPPALKAGCFAIWDRPFFPEALDWTWQYVTKNCLSNGHYNTRAKQILKTAKW